jgi:hypothetical protein
MTTRRYEIKQQADGKWCVIDVFTGLPPALNHFFPIDMSREKAQKLADELNHQDAKRRAARGR